MDSILYSTWSIAVKCDFSRWGMPSNWNVARLRPQMNLWCFSWTGAEDLLIYVTHWKVNIFVWVDEEKSQPLSNMGSMGSPPSYTHLSVLRMCLAQVAGRWGNTWHWACFPNVSVWDKRDESPERKSLTAQDFPWDFACCWSRRRLLRAECARAHWERGQCEHLGMPGNGIGVAVLKAGLGGITLPLPALFSRLRKIWFLLPRVGGFSSYCVWAEAW